MNDHEELLKSVPLFSELPRKALDRIGKILVQRRYPAGAEIVTEGESGAAFFLIAAGAVEVLRGPGQTRVATLKKGSHFGEMALLDKDPRSATVRAIEPTTCLALNRWHFLAELRGHPDLAIELLGVLSRRVRDAEQRLSEQEARQTLPAEV